MPKKSVAANGIRVIEFDASDPEVWMLLGALLPTLLATNRMSEQTDMVGESGETVTDIIYQVDLHHGRGICRNKLSNTFFIDLQGWLCCSEELAEVYMKEIRETGASLPVSFLIRLCCHMVTRGGLQAAVAA